MLYTELFIFIAGIVASFIGSVAAGSGIVAISALVFLGIPPHIALGTINFADIGSKLGNIIRFVKSKNMGVLKRDVIILTLISVPAAMLGSRIAVSVKPEILEKAIGVILLIILLLFFLQKNLGIKADRAVGKRRVLSHIAYFLSQAWAGFFSPGSGFIDIYIRTRGYGYTILQAKAVTRIPLLLASISSVVVFAMSGLINYRYAVIMFFGMMIGGYLGTALSIKKGDAWLKPLIGILILGTAFKLLFIQ
jgi:uncharacterized membrane protein YfcA